MPMRGISRFSIENLLPHSAENFRRGTLLCFRKLLLSKNVRDNKGCASSFFVENFLSHSAEIFRSGTFRCFLNFGYRKFYAYEGNITIFYRKFFVSQYRKILWGNPSVFHKISGIEKLYG